MEIKHMYKSRSPRNSQAGMTLIELMIAIMILAIGMGALTNLLVIAMETDNRNAKDPSATLLAQMVVEQIGAQHPNSSAAISVTDCAGNAWNVATAGGASPIQPHRPGSSRKWYCDQPTRHDRAASIRDRGS